MPSLRSIGFACAIAIQAAACSSSTLTATHDAGRDVTTPHDAAPADAARVCPSPVATCPADAGSSCADTWAAVLARPPRCAAFMPPSAIGMQELRATCGTYDIDQMNYVDSSFTSYYDMTTGRLVAVYGSSLESCQQGPPGGISICHPTNLVNLCVQDAGAADRKLDAAATDATRDAARLDAGPACPAPVTDQCTTDAGDPCRRTWDEVLATPLRCDRPMGPGDTSVQESRQTCGAYNVVLFEHLDWMRLYYYDMTTGKLVAVYFSGNAQPASCVAGPTAGIAPCQLSGAPPCHPDAGTDARG